MNYYLGEVVVVKEGHGEVYEVDNEAMLRVVDLLQRAGALVDVGDWGTDLHLDGITVSIEGLYLE